MNQTMHLNDKMSGITTYDTNGNGNHGNASKEIVTNLEGELSNQNVLSTDQQLQSSDRQLNSPKLIPDYLKKKFQREKKDMQKVIA